VFEASTPLSKKVLFSSIRKAWFSLAALAHAQTQMQAIGITQVKAKFDANASASKIIQTVRHFGKLFRREVIWIQ